MKANIISEAELAKTTVINSPLDDDTKRNLVMLISKSALATNGISPEEKIQHLTECMASLASALAIYMSKSDKRLDYLEKQHIAEHPASKIEQLQKFEHMLSETEKYRNMNGIVPNIRGNVIATSNDEKSEDDTLIDKVFNLLEKPYIWIFGAVAVCSPFAVDVINSVIAAFK